MAKKRTNYYKRLNDDMHDVYAERNILRAERDSARKSAEAYRRKYESAYADIERRESELREKEAMTADERMRMKYETMRERYMDMKSELRRYRGVIKEMQRLLQACEAGHVQAVLCMDIDRLGRGSMAEQGYILDTFKKSRVRLITPRKAYDLHNDLDETYSEFESFIARQELKAPL